MSDFDGTGSAIFHYYKVVSITEWNALIEYSTVEALSTLDWYNAVVVVP